MSSVTTAASRVVQRPTQEVYVNGTLRPDIECHRINFGFNLTPSRADFFLPSLRAGDAANLRDAEVVVYCQYNSSPSASDPVFRGFLVPEKHNENASKSTVFASALSPISLLDKYFVGQKAGRGLVSYPKLDPATGDKTNWTLATIIQDMFSTANYDSNWRSKIDLGTVWGARAAARYVLMPDVTFPATSYKAALARLLAIAPDVGVRERFTKSCTYLDFYQIGTVQAWRTLTLPNNTGPEDGAWGEAHAREDDLDRIYSRVIGYGAPRKTQITVPVVDPPPPLDAISDAYLEPFWQWFEPGNPIGNLATPYSSHPTVGAGEQRVLYNPALATLGDPEYDADVGECFRKFRLPACLRGYDFASENVAVDVNGKRIGFQVFKEHYDLVDDGAGGVTSKVSTTEFDMIRGAKFDREKCVLELPAPALYLSAVQYVSASEPQKIIWLPANVYITITVVETNGNRLCYDTGIRGDVRIPTIENTGLTYCFTNEKIRWEQVGSDIDQFDNHTFGSYHWDETQSGAPGQWLATALGTPTVIAKDAQYLAMICEGYLSERMTRRKTASATVQFSTTAYRIGDGLIVKNRGIDNHMLQIVTVSVDYVNNRTTVVATSQVPHLTDSFWAGRLDNRNLGRAVNQGISTPNDWRPASDFEPFGRAYPTTPDGKKDWAERQAANEVRLGRERVRADEIAAGDDYMRNAYRDRPANRGGGNEYQPPLPTPVVHGDDWKKLYGLKE